MEDSMHKEIGSNFWINKYDKLDEQKISLDFLRLNITDIAYLSTGRSAISFVLNHINVPDKNKTALLPSFTCHTVIEPFVNAGYKVCFYRINKDLSIDRKTFLDDIKQSNPSAILIHGYFGFNTLENIKDTVLEIREKNIVLIEDITQTMYSGFKHIPADYYICSFRKWAALPDGGCAISTGKSFSYKPIKKDMKLEKAKLDAFHAKYLYINKDIGKKDNFLKMFNDAEEILSKQKFMYAMGNISKKIQANLDIDFLKKRRRKNFSTLCESLHNNKILEPVFAELEEYATPLYFPVYIKNNRKKFQDYLAKNDIYAPIIWPKPSQYEEQIDSQVNWIYKHILSIPCDQRYGDGDMERIIKTVKNFENKSD